jgi:5,10-methylenetetrahydromethanopterin reductase
MIGDSAGPRIGFMFDRDRAPEELAGYAATLEELGADDLWVVEDLGWAGSIGAAATALAATRRLRVGIGIAPVALRNAALLAMEVALLARLHPERLVPGVGHGVPEWMQKVGAAPVRKLALLEETITAVRGLLAGETVVLHGREVTVDGVRLTHPPRTVPPLVTGVVRPKSLELSGRVADGTILAEGAGPAEVVAALEHIGRGRRAGDRPRHEVIVFAFLHVTDHAGDAGDRAGDAGDRAGDAGDRAGDAGDRAGDDAGHTVPAVRAAIEGQAAWLGVAPENVFALIGPASGIASQVAALRAAGADTVVLRPLGADPDGQTRAAMAALRV